MRERDREREGGGFAGIDLAAQECTCEGVLLRGRIDTAVSFWNSVADSHTTVKEGMGRGGAEHLTCLVCATEEGPSVPYAHLVRGVDPHHLTLTGRDWLIGLDRRFLGGTGLRCLPASGHRLLPGEAVVVVGRDGKPSPPGPQGGCREWDGLTRRPLWPDLPPSPS